MRAARRRPTAEIQNMMKDRITIAVSKGRICAEALPLLEQAGIRPTDAPETSRKLIFDTSKPGVRLVIVRASDVPTYIINGGADLGIAGKDVLMECPNDNLYEPLDLKIACCRMMLAGPEHASDKGGRLRVATKYVTTTREYFAGKGEQVELIRLYGSMELAPLLGLADYIVDLVNTGNTLKANGLAPLGTIAAISSRLVVNKAAMKMKRALIKPLIDQLAEVVARQ